jgi:hypothetical protein
MALTTTDSPLSQCARFAQSRARHAARLQRHRPGSGPPRYEGGSERRVGLGVAWGVATGGNGLSGGMRRWETPACRSESDTARTLTPWRASDESEARGLRDCGGA